MYAIDIKIGQPSAKSSTTPRTRRSDEFVSAEVERLYAELAAHQQKGADAYSQVMAAAQAWREELDSLDAALSQALEEAGISQTDERFPPSTHQSQAYYELSA